MYGRDRVFRIVKDLVGVCQKPFEVRVVVVVFRRENRFEIELIGLRQVDLVVPFASDQVEHIAFDWTLVVHALKVVLAFEYMLAEKIGPIGQLI